MSEGRKKQRAPRLSRAEAAELLKEYEASGLSRAVFCERREMGMTTLARYFRWRAEDSANTNRWVSVEVSAEEQRPVSHEGTLSVALANGRRIEVNRGFDGVMLEELVRVLERV